MPDAVSVIRSGLWVKTLAARDADDSPIQRDRLRAGFMTLRDRASQLSQEIRRDLPDLTVHDVTHLDALWDLASMILGDDYTFTPTEGFVFGGAVLLHDMAMSIAGTPGGFSTIRADPRWSDIIISEYNLALMRDPSKAEIDEPEPGIKKASLLKLLRLVHAENAERLLFQAFAAPGGNQMYLLDDIELRQTFGELIGRIAHSHWWSITQVEAKLDKPVGAPHWCPSSWTVDPLKVACLLRLADAAHIDARRAPPFLKAFSEIGSSSEYHWRFQEKLNRPYLKEDALVFTSGASFTLSDAPAWWLCLETLRDIDRELRSVDVFLADTSRPRFAARRVAGVDTPERIVQFVRTAGWLPINAMIHVSDLPHVVRSIGGDALYGKTPNVVLRELIQNSRDAIHARRIVENRAETFGQVTVALDEIEGEHWLQVEDTGIGMSQRVLTDFLLDFGRSFWGSQEMLEEFPGLLCKGLRSIGRFGIGFFSVFMIADVVEITSRRSDGAARETLILQFGSGLKGRPTLRPATASEQLIDGGTRVRVRLNVAPTAEGGILHSNTKRSWTLRGLCQHLAPALDVDLLVRRDGKPTVVVASNDWIKIGGKELLARMPSLTLGIEVEELLVEGPESESLSEPSEPLNPGNHVANSKPSLVDRRQLTAENLRFINGMDGSVLGRACITPGYARDFSRPSSDVEGVVTIGGFRGASLTGISGILVGETSRASRDAARPLAPPEQLRIWAEEQANLVPQVWHEPADQAACAQYIRLCGGNTKDLPIAEHNGKWVSASQIASFALESDELILLDNYQAEDLLRLLPSFKFDKNIIMTRVSGIPGLLQGRSAVRWPSVVDSGYIYAHHEELALGGAVVEAVASAWGIVLPKIDKRELVRVGVDDERVVLRQGVRLSRTEREKTTIV